MSDFGDKLPASAHIFSMTFAHLNSALNPVFYGIFNPAFRKGYKQFFNKIKGIFNKASSRETISGAKFDKSINYKKAMAHYQSDQKSCS